MMRKGRQLRTGEQELLNDQILGMVDFIPTNGSGIDKFQ